MALHCASRAQRSLVPYNNKKNYDYLNGSKHKLDSIAEEEVVVYIVGLLQP